MRVVSGSLLFLCLVLAVLTTVVNAATTTADNNATPATTNVKAAAATTDSSNLPDISSSTSKSAVHITASDSSDSSDGDVPSMTTAMPTISKAYTIPTHITPPPTANNPFMQKSSAPDGTVFIAVGSGLGFFALLILAWRGLVAWSLHRSVQRAANQANMADSKAMLRPVGPPGAGYYSNAANSTLSLDHLSSNPRSGTGSNGRTQTPSGLFFSPTANSSAGGNRQSTYLPSGFYTSGNRGSAALSNSSQLHIPTQSASSSRFTRAPGVSPPGSPLMGPRPGSNRGNPPSPGHPPSGMRMNDSQASLALPPTGRAPSAYLEDLFENHQVDSSPGQHNRRSRRYS